MSVHYTCNAAARFVRIRHGKKDLSPAQARRCAYRTRNDRTPCNGRRAHGHVGAERRQRCRHLEPRARSDFWFRTGHFPRYRNRFSGARASRGPLGAGSSCATGHRLALRLPHRIPISPYLGRVALDGRPGQGHLRLIRRSIAAVRRRARYHRAQARGARAGSSGGDSGVVRGRDRQQDTRWKSNLLERRCRSPVRLWRRRDDRGVDHADHPAGAALRGGGNPEQAQAR